MAFLISLRKIRDTEDLVVYRYEQPIYAQDPLKPRRRVEIGKQFGEVALDKKSGELEWPSGKDWDVKGVICDRVCFKLARCWKDGSYPELLHWAS
jgi:hypothetical protein